MIAVYYNHALTYLIVVRAWMKTMIVTVEPKLMQHKPALPGRRARKALLLVLLVQAHGESCDVREILKGLTGKCHQFISTFGISQAD
jgi:hypothetical protein